MFKIFASFDFSRSAGKARKLDDARRQDERDCADTYIARMRLATLGAVAASLIVFR